MASTRRIRILQVLEATTGGTRKHLRLLLTNLDLSRFSVALAYSNGRDPCFANDLREFARRGIELHEAPIVRPIRPGRDLAALWRIFRIVRRGNYDIVHAHSSKAGCLGRIAGWLAGTPAVVYSPHSFAFQENPHSFTGTCYRWIERAAARCHHRLLCVSEGERRIAVESGIEREARTCVIPNAIDASEYASPRDKRRTRRAWNLPEETPVVGVVAQFRRQKGYDCFLGAVPRILRERPETRFLVVGDGSLFPAVKKEIQSLGLESRIALAGYQEDPTAFYHAMDVFVMCSLWEGMPYTVLEAMASGLPIVATDATGTNELVRHGRNGFLAPVGDREAVAGRVVELLRDTPLRERFARESRAISRALPGVRQWIRRYESFYAGLLETDRT
ncbi:MAG: glycosyltransferase family 4 protein [Candidatus Sumerlaeota bacterium]|nr:glycosyltransferase family 4 protein [Candidatus Sumerlaeota bacterium]